MIDSCRRSSLFLRKIIHHQHLVKVRSQQLTKGFVGRMRQIGVPPRRIGKGEVWLVGDTDLLFAPQWRPLVPGAEHLRQADTMEWLAARLWPGAGQTMLRPLWIRSRAA